MILTDYKTHLRNQLIIFIFIVAGLGWLIITLNKKNKSIQSELNDIATRFAAITTTTIDFNDMKKRYEEEIAEFKSRTSTFKTEHEYLNFIRSIAEMAQKYNVVLSKLEPFLDDEMPDIKKHQTFNRHKMERFKTNFNLNGRFKDIGRFLESLDRVKEGIHINTCNIRKTKAESQEITAKVMVSTYRVIGP